MALLSLCSLWDIQPGMIQNTDKIKTILGRRLSAWYRINRRALPWRKTTDPYRIWISEIMLQQTQVDTVIPYYQRFLQSFPDVRSLALAPQEEVLKAWENLGYYSRARNLHAAAKMIVHDFNSRIPDTPEDIRKLPGIGPYSAGAILSIAYGKPLPAVDGNVRRIFSRLFAIQKPVDDAREQKKMFELAASLIPAGRPGDFNQALMDLGATICKPQKPACASCPVTDLCLAHKAGIQGLLPVTRKAPRIPHRQSVCAIILNPERKLLIVQRPATGLLASMWKLPGGFTGDAEKAEAALMRGVREELGISIRVGKRLASVDHTYTHFKVTLSAWECTSLAGHPKTLACQNWRWARIADLKKLPMSKIDRMILAAVSSPAMILSKHHRPGTG